MDTSNIDAQAFKASMRAQWDAAAAGWDAHTPDIRAWLRTPTDAMCRMAGVGPGSRVLDVAAGAGDQTLRLAEWVGPRGHVLATDLSPAIVALARANARRAGFGQVEARVADGEDLGVAEAGFDAAVCRLGLMFFAEPLRGLREMFRALRPGGGLCTMVFSGPENNPCVAILGAAAARRYAQNCTVGPQWRTARKP
jgi:ubiquinone/menaquinone biosynthesis C-methylase UbiE